MEQLIKRSHARMRMVRWCLGLLLAVLLAAALPTARAQNQPRYFQATGHYLRGAFRSFWERRGGLANFGYPITEEYERQADRRIVQYFERAREQLQLWITSPDGVYYLAGTANADARGRIGDNPALLVQFGAQNPAGVYGYHYRGVRSGARVDLYFTFTGQP